MNTPRPVTVTLAIVLLILLSVFALITPFLPVDNKPLLIITVPGFLVEGIGGLIAVVGLWRLKWWGLWLARVIAALGILLSVPGLFLAPGAGGKVFAVGLIAAKALVLVLVTLPATRQAVAAARVRLAA